MFYESNLSIYLREISVFPRLTRAEERSIVTMMAEGDQVARDHLIRCHLALALKLARRQHRSDRSFDLAELISEANVGLVKAADTYTPNQGYRFSTHAMFSIREAIRNHVAACADGLPIPPAAHRQLRRYRLAAQVIRQATGREPEFSEVCDSLNLNPAQRREMAAKLAAVQPIVLRVESGAEGMCDASDRKASTINQVEMNDLLARLLAMLAHLDDEDVEIIRLRYGIGFDRPRSRREIAASVGMSIPTVAAIEHSVLRRLSAELLD